jgi:hypothetical protein
VRPLLALALALAPVPALAQQPAPAPSTCDVQIDSSHGQSRYIKAPNGAYDTFAAGGIWAHCLNQQATRMYSDSVAWYPDRDLLYLIGNVRFRDSITVLNADHVTYYLHQERLYAEGHVYTQNTRTRSDLRGNNLDYYRVAPPLRDTVELFATQRPTIRFYSSGQTAQSDTEPFVVVADRTHMRGSDEMWGGGNVTINRSDLAAHGDSAWLDLGHDAAALLGSPEVDGVGPDAYHLKGDRLTFGLTPQHEIRRVLSSGHAVGHGPDWRLDADTLDLALDSGKVQRAQAWGRQRRPVAVSGVHTIVADSLDIHMPGQLVKLVWAWGKARMVTRDTTARPAADTAHAAAGRPVAADTGRKAVAGDSASRFVLVGEDDWLMGDSLRADFATLHDSTTGKPKSELSHLASFGSARAFYHVESSDSTCRGRRGIDYSRGLRIAIAMQHSKVATVDVVGQTDGMYLEPDCPRADTTHQADSTRAAADSTGRPAADTLHAAPAPTAPRPAAPDSAAQPTPARRAAVKPRP